MSTTFSIVGPRNVSSQLASMCKDAWAEYSSLFVDYAIFDVPDDGQSAYIFVQGSVRGLQITVSTRLFKSTIECVINEGGGTVDWILCYAFLRFCAKLRGVTITNEDGQSLKLQQLTDDAARQDCQHSLLRTIALLEQIVLGKGEPASLPVRYFALRISPELIQEIAASDQPTALFETRLAESAERYASARVANQIVLKDQRTLTVWACEALIAPISDFIVMPTSIEAEIETAGYRYIPWEVALMLISSRAEPLGLPPKSFYFPALNLHDSEDAHLFADLLSLGKENL